MKRFIVSVFALATFTLISVVAPTSEAHADSFTGSCANNSSICRADDANMDFCTPVPWPLEWGSPFTDAMINLDAQTDMYDTYQSVCGPQTDLGGYLNTSPEWTLGSSTRGLYSCTKPIGSYGSGVCDQASVLVNTSLLPNYAQRKKTFCHEIGHAAGLYHDTGIGGCMVSGSSTATSYAAHHVAHINSAY
ncbi:zinc-dependent metalloprotease family protein [Compostimonas suwonensis]|uniref:Reprolysin-like metallo-peptidase family M12B n=1 Tax=Compostimonas suwonensis TaxID=1048394 RepID=A0A2M9BUU5_9MICO|nr:reprolysin-like metallo-peptidase family M12B [Compostimonas suwonensis]